MTVFNITYFYDEYEDEVENGIPGRVVFLLVLYVVLFVVGIVGNSFVLLALVCHKVTLPARRSPHSHGLSTVRLYVITLCAVDIMLIALLPMTISDIYYRSWMFGTIGCKLHWGIDPANKILSVWILSALSIDRYLVICNPLPTFTSCRQDSRVGAVVILVLVCLSMLVVSPIMWSAGVVTVSPLFELDYEFYDDQEFTFNSTLMPAQSSQLVYKCYEHLSDGGRELLVLFLVVFAFVIPFALISFANYEFIRKMVVQGQFEGSRLPISRLVLFILVTELFHFVCWLPYYIVNVTVMFAPTKSAAMGYLFYVVHSLPYLNSSVNWIFYAFLNKHLQIECCELWRSVCDSTLNTVRRGNIRHSESHNLTIDTSDNHNETLL